MSETVAHYTLPPRPRTRGRVALIVLAVAGFTVLTCVPAIGGIDLDFGAIIRNWSNGSSILVQFLQPDFSFLPRTIEPMLETLQMALVGAFFAALISVPLTLWAAAPTNPNAISRRLVRAVINVVRAVPDLVYATVLVAMIGVGVLPGVITLFLFDIGIVVKLVSEAIDSCLEEIAADSEILQYIESPYTRLAIAWGGALVTSIQRKRVRYSRRRDYYAPRMEAREPERPDPRGQHSPDRGPPDGQEHGDGGPAVAKCVKV